MRDYLREIDLNPPAAMGGPINNPLDPRAMHYFGFLAEDVALVMDNLVGYEMVDGVKKPGWIEYDYLTAPLVKAVQELHARVVVLESRP